MTKKNISTSEKTSSPCGKKKIMIADDDPGILEAMQIMLEDTGYEVATTVDGQSVHDIKEELPDLIVLDIWMAGTNGKEICEQLKSQEITKHIPIIMCSANKDTEQIARKSGADDFLTKPFDMNNFLAKVAKNLNNR